MSVLALTLDAAGTLIEPAEPVAAVYQREFARVGWQAQPERLLPAFHAAFAACAKPNYDHWPNGEEAESAWWRDVVTHAATNAGAPPSFVRSAAFDDAFAALFSHYAAGTAWRLFPDVIPFLTESRARGWRLAVLSNFDVRLHRVLDELGVAGQFEFILTSATARARKPNAEIFHQAVERFALTTGHIAHAGDSPDADFAGPRAVGIAAFLLNRPQTGLADFLAWLDRQCPC